MDQLLPEEWNLTFAYYNTSDYYINETSEPVNLLELLGPKRDSLYIVIPITIIYAIIFLTGVIGNVSTCVVIARNKSMHTATNYYLFSLAVSDLLLLVTGLPQEMYSIWSRYPYVFGEVFCVLRGLASETSANATVLTITAFTIERYVAICHPFLSHTMSKLSRAIKLILAVWLVSFAFALPQALQFGIKSDQVVRCTFKKTIIKHSFEISTFLFFVAPMTLITVLYALIGIRLKTSNMMKRNSTHTDRKDNCRRSCRHNHGQSSRRVVKMLVAVVVAFFICWAPFHAQRLVAIHSNSLQTPAAHKLKLYEIVTYTSGVLYYVSTTVNPVLYHIMSNKFREAFKETFSRCWRSCGTAGAADRSDSMRSGGSGPRQRTATISSDQHRPRSCYSILSRTCHTRAARNGRSGVGDGCTGNGAAPRRTASAHDSTDSGATLTYRVSDDSMVVCQNHHPHQPCAALCSHQETTTSTTDTTNASLLPSPVTATNKLNLEKSNGRGTAFANRIRSSRANRFLRLFRCLAKHTLDENRIPPSDSPASDKFVPDIVSNECYPMSPCNVSNSSLRDIEHGALEDELTIYMKEIQRREKDNI